MFLCHANTVTHCYSWTGFLTGAIKSIDDLEPNDHRRGMPRMQEAFQEVWYYSERLVSTLIAMGRRI
jgi:hypothetical protein